MRADQILSERPAPVAPLPPWGVAKSVTFSMAIDNNRQSFPSHSLPLKITTADSCGAGS